MEQERQTQIQILWSAMHIAMAVGLLMGVKAASLAVVVSVATVAAAVVHVPLALVKDIKNAGAQLFTAVQLQSLVDKPAHKILPLQYVTCL
jgi:hypothetical protein